MKKDKRETNIPFTSPSKWKDRTSAWCKLVDEIREFKPPAGEWQVVHLREKERYLIPFSDSLKKCLAAIEKQRCEYFEGKYKFKNPGKNEKIEVHNQPTIGAPALKERIPGNECIHVNDAMCFLDIPWDQIKPNSVNDETKFPNTDDFP
jgi:hypothetical protein